MTTIATVSNALAKRSPLGLAEDWDNVGLLVGDPQQEAKSILVCLTLTPDVVEEAVRLNASLVITHHPLPFRSMKRITTETIEGASLWRLIRAGVAVYSLHTAYDSSANGVNQQIAAGLGLKSPVPFVSYLTADDSVDKEIEPTGTGRIGDCPTGETLASLAKKVKEFFGVPMVKVVGESEQPITKLAIACGSGGSLLDQAVAADCDAFLTGEATFHDCLKARSLGIVLFLVGHYASERFAIEQLAAELSEEFSDITVLASQIESDPVTLA